jgi:hypothetical protein
MIELAKDPAVTDTSNLLTHYGFDLGGYSVEQLLDRWLRNYPISWLRPAVIEALYQGRYKAVSVEQILTLWRRRGQPLQHFNHEFERILCSRLPQTLTHIAMSKPKARSAAAVSEIQPEPLAQPQIGENSVNLVQPSVSPETSEPDSELPTTSELSVTGDKEDRSPHLPQLLLPMRSDSPNPGSDPAQASHDANFDKSNLMLWSDAQGSKLPIHQFVPAPATSEFYIKLKAVAHLES